MTAADLLTVEDAAPRLGKAPFTVRQWCNSERIAAAKMGKEWRIHPDEIERVLREGINPTRGARHARKRRAK